MVIKLWLVDSRHSANGELTSPSDLDVVMRKVLACRKYNPDRPTLQSYKLTCIMLDYVSVLKV